MKVKSESEVTQSCPTLRDPMGLQPTKLLRPRVLEWLAIAFSKLHFTLVHICDMADINPTKRIHQG